MFFWHLSMSCESFLSSRPSRPLRDVKWLTLVIFCALWKSCISNMHIAMHSRWALHAVPSLSKEILLVYKHLHRIEQNSKVTSSEEIIWTLSLGALEWSMLWLRVLSSVKRRGRRVHPFAFIAIKPNVWLCSLVTKQRIVANLYTSVSKRCHKGIALKHSSRFVVYVTEVSVPSSTLYRAEQKVQI